MPEDTPVDEPSIEQPTSVPEAPQPPADEPFDAERAQAKIRKANSEAENLRKRLKELEPLAQRAQELEDANKSETQRLTEQLAAATERATAASKRAVAAKVEALAAADFADPEDAAGAIDPTEFVDETGRIDVDGIKTALTELLQRKPHWAKPADRRAPAPDRSQGSSGNQHRPSDPAAVFAGILRDRMRP